MSEVIRRYAMFAPGGRVGVAVSGGADSVCLLHLLHQLAPRWNLHLSVVHVDHGIRGAASAADAEFVRALAAEFGLPFHFRKADVPAIRDNLEQAARHVRQEFFRELLVAGAAGRIATGHTRSDQGETVLYRLLRGSGLAGLSGIQPVTREGIVRPLIESTRGDVLDWLRGAGIHWREDETNQDPGYARNRIRHELLPQLREQYNPQIDDTLANLADIARDEEAYWSSVILPVKKEADVCLLRISELTREPAVGRRLIRRAIEALKGDLRQIEFQHVQRVFKMACSEQGHGRAQIPGVDVFRSFDWIRLAPQGYDSGRERDFSIALRPPETVKIPGTGQEISFQLIDRQSTSSPEAPCDSLIEELDWQKIVLAGGAGVLEVRNWRPGDHYRRAGQTNEQKIKHLFQEARVPLWERRSWPILTACGKIVWCRGFGPATEFAASQLSTTILRIRDSNRAGS